MMFLTRVTTDAADAARRRLSDRYRWHQEIWKAFPDVPEGTTQDHLFRLDFHPAQIILWILSSGEPKPLDWGRWETKEVNKSFLSHSRYEFALCANPTVMRVVRLEDGSRKKNGRRTTIYSEEELKEWLAQKGEKNGFRVEQSLCDPPVKDYFYKGKQSGVHARVDFRGILSVTDADRFASAWKNGIGSAKAFGFGLLLLKPID